MGIIGKVIEKLDRLFLPEPCGCKYETFYCRHTYSGYDVLAARCRKHAQEKLVQELGKYHRQESAKKQRRRVHDELGAEYGISPATTAKLIGETYEPSASD